MSSPDASLAIVARDNFVVEIDPSGINLVHFGNINVG